MGRINFLFAIIKFQAANWWGAVLKVASGEVRLRKIFMTFD
jgi:hypothetical protein